MKTIKTVVIITRYLFSSFPLPSFVHKLSSLFTICTTIIMLWFFVTHFLFGEGAGGRGGKGDELTVITLVSFLIVFVLPSSNLTVMCIVCRYGDRRLLLTCRWWTPGPTLATKPEASWPSTIGQFTTNSPAQCACVDSRQQNTKLSKKFPFASLNVTMSYIKWQV